MHLLTVQTGCCRKSVVAGRKSQTHEENEREERESEREKMRKREIKSKEDKM